MQMMCSLSRNSCANALELKILDQKKREEGGGGG